MCEVIATTIKSGLELLNSVEDITKAGRCLLVDKSVNGKGTSTTCPGL